MYKSVVTFILMVGVSASVLFGADPQLAPVSKASPNAVRVSADQPYARAIEKYKTALKENPKDAESHNMLGVCYQGSNRLSAALKEYQQAVSIDARYAEAWNNLGSVYHGQRKLKQAVKNYRHAIELKPDMAAAHKNLGTALLQMGKIEEGTAAYRRACELDPDIFAINPEAAFSVPGTDPAVQFYYFAKFSAAGGRVDAALTFLKKAQEYGFHDFIKIYRDPDFKLVVADPRFANLTR